MHGLFPRAFQRFVCDAYGPKRWSAIVGVAQLEFESFEPMLHYDRDLIERVLAAAERQLEKALPELMEDMGTHVISHPSMERVRRLMRFCGTGFLDFLYSLDDLPGRARLALADLELPVLELREHRQGRFTLAIGPGVPCFGHVMLGALRAMADDYGALVLLEHSGASGRREMLDITVVEAAFAQGRTFDLAG